MSYITWLKLLYFLCKLFFLKTKSFSDERRQSSPTSAASLIYSVHCVMPRHVCLFRGPVSVITPTVVKEVCSRLLAKAVEAEREDQSPAQTEDMVLEEFSDCLNEIVMTMFNTH